MHKKQLVYAFTNNIGILANQIKTSVSVSAHKGLFPNAQEKEFYAIWDTGATNTAITENVAKECKLEPTGQTTINTANGERIANTYVIDIKLPNNVIVESIIATEVTGVKGAELLIGMDVITLGDFCISNFEDKTTFTFRYPSIAKTDYVKQIKTAQPYARKEDKVARNDLCPCRKWEKIQKLPRKMIV